MTSLTTQLRRNNLGELEIGLPTLDVGTYDPYTDTITIEGTRYAGVVFRDGFGINAIVGQTIRIDKHENGVVTITKLESAE